jgi:hypothetical protein
MKLPISVGKTKKMKRALNKAFRGLGISRFVDLMAVGFFVNEVHSGKDDNNNLPCLQPPKKVLSEILGIFHCLGKSKKGEMYVFCSTCARGGGMTADNTFNPNHTWISKS